MTHDEARDLMILDLYGETTEAESQALKHYLESHPELQSEFDDLATTHTLMDSRTVDDPGDLFWHRFTAQVERRMQTKTTSSSVPIKVVFATAAVLVIGFFAGRMSQEDTESKVRVVQPVAESDRRAHAFLARSETLLMGFTDPVNVSTIGFDVPRRVSEKLLVEGDSLKQSMSPIEQERLGRLITDLQTVLRQIANIEDDQNALGLELVKTGMEHGDILFRINIEQIRSAKDRATENRSLRRPKS